MVSTLTIGAVLTLVAWVGLQVAVVHRKYVVDKIAAGEYDEGPFDKRDGGFDSIIIGAASEGILRRVLFGEIPETIGAEFEGEVVTVRKHRPVQSAVKRFIGKWIGKGAKATNLGEIRQYHPVRY